MIGKKLEKNNLAIAVNVFYTNKEKIYPDYVSKHILNCQKRVIVLMIPKKEWWHYVAVKQLPALLRGVTSKHDSDFYCLNCLYSFRTENKLKSHNKVFKNNDFFNIVVPSNDTKILEFNQYQNLIKHHLLFLQILNV